MRVLNVGGGAGRDLPSIYKGWEQDLLDIDQNVKPDIVCDAKTMRKLPAGKYDAIYCSHNLEHFYKHEVPQVLGGFMHVLKKNGFAHIAVPDMGVLFDCIVKGNRDIDDVWYRVDAGPITFHDVIYGWSKAVGQGNLYYSHKTGFTEKSMGKTLRASGFKAVMTATDGMGNIHAFAFKSKPSKARLQRLGI